MKDQISTVWLVGLVVIFIFIFSAYIIITVDYSKTFKLKNEVLNIVEKNNGMTFVSSASGVSSQRRKSIIPGHTSETVAANVGTLRTINAFLSASSYNAKGPCGVKKGDNIKIYGVKSLKFESVSSKSQLIELAGPNKTYYYCFSKHKTNVPSGIPSVFYKVQLFYKFEIPVLSTILPIRVDGMTDEIYYPVNDVVPSSDLNSSW